MAGIKMNKLFGKIFTLGVVITLAFILVLGWVFLKLRGNLYEAKRVKTKHLVEAVVTIIDYYSKQARDGSLTTEEAQVVAKETVRAMRYDGKEYFFIADTKAFMLMHPIKKEEEGKDWSDMKDPNGVRFIAEMAEVAKRAGEGYVNYQFLNPATSKVAPKISYVKLFSEWGWVVGSGIYVDDVEREVNQTLLVVFTVALFLFVGAIAFSLVIAQSISGPLTRVIAELGEGADQTSAAAAQVSSASQELSQGATEQAASLEETSSSLDEMNSMTKQNADNAAKANQIAQSARQSAEEGNTSMSQMLSAMVAINESSDKISKIIKTIEEIAFQTNLLALNAAVEAARAGEHGKGFAVVADEVRNLAQRAASAAKDTAALIEDNVNKTKSGAEVAKKAGEALHSIMGEAKKVADIVGEISAASKEQAEGIAQVTNAVSQMDQVTQQNASAAEETASSSEELASQAETIKGIVYQLQCIIGEQNKDFAGASAPAASRTADRRVGTVAVAQPEAQKKTPLKLVKPPVVAAAKKSAGPKVIRPEEVIPLDETEL